MVMEQHPPQAGAATSQATEAAATGGPGDAGQAQVVHQCWRTAFDHNSQRWYFYNYASGERRWDPPPGWLPPPVVPMPPPMLHPAAAAAAAAAAHAAAAHHHHLAQVAAAAAAAAAAAPSTGSGAVPSQHQPAAAGSDPLAASASASAAAALPATHPAASPVAASAGGSSGSSAVAAVTLPAEAAPGYYYVDAQGITQGPFCREQLQAWRGQLPMDLQLLHYAGASGSGGSQGQPEGQGEQQQGQQQQEQQRVGGAAEHADSSGASGGGSNGGSSSTVELAEVLGDGDLLARWRLDNPEKAATPNSAPNADDFERELRDGGGYSAYAAAALAGLPAHDDAVQVARLAAFSGKSIQDVLDFNYGNGGLPDYTVTALHSKGLGRVQAADAAPEGLYSEMGRWVDASTVEDQLARVAEARRKGLSGKELAALKARKQEMKRKKTMEWLMR